MNEVRKISDHSYRVRSLKEIAEEKGMLGELPKSLWDYQVLSPKPTQADIDKAKELSENV